MGYVNVYLQSLGLTKNLLSVVWVAGPLSGLLMQPLVGVLSDNSTSKYGRRRPYIMGGSMVVTVGLLVMAWAPDIVAVFVNSNVVTIVIAVVSVFITDFAINAVQACCRAIIVDTLPTSKQQLGNGWAGRMIAIGHLVGYFAGYLDLVTIFRGWLGSTQLKSLCVVSSASLLACSGVTCYAVTERSLAPSTHPTDQSVVQQVLGIFKQLLQTVHTLPRRMRLIFLTQLCAWYGWFSFLFYSSAWVSEVYIKYSAPASSQKSREDMVGELGRVGSLSLMVFSTVSLIGSLVLPEIVRRRMWRLNLVKMWFMSHLVYFVASLLTGAVRSVTQATVVVGVFGVSWAVTTWAPFALLGEEILKLTSGYELANLDNDEIERLDVATPLSTASPSSRRSSVSAAASGAATPGTTGDQSGIYLGIHNVAITMPQFVSTLGSFVIFSALQRQQPAGGDGGGDNTNNHEDSNAKLPTTPGEGDGGRAIAWTFQVGSITALLGAYFVRRLQR